MLIIRDGWGYNPNPAEDKFNAIKCAKVPVDTMLMSEYPHTIIHTSGEDVGLPEGTMGNSEVGHQNIGAGRIVYQESVRITLAIRNGEFFQNAEFKKMIESVRKNNGALHFMGLCSDIASIRCCRTSMGLWSLPNVTRWKRCSFTPLQTGVIRPPIAAPAISPTSKRKMPK